MRGAVTRAPVPVAGCQSKVLWSSGVGRMLEDAEDAALLLPRGNLTSARSESVLSVRGCTWRVNNCLRGAPLRSSASAELLF